MNPNGFDVRLKDRHGWLSGTSGRKWTIKSGAYQIEDEAMAR
jgi:hypothetical protein